MVIFQMCTPLESTDLVRVEQEFGIVLPDDYKTGITTINGGALSNAYIVVEPLGEVPYCRNVPLHREARGNIYDLFESINDGAVTLFPFGSVGNGDYFCFDFAASTVVLYLHEIQSTVDVCDTFTQLMDRLTEE